MCVQMSTSHQRHSSGSWTNKENRRDIFALSEESGLVNVLVPCCCGEQSSHETSYLIQHCCHSIWPLFWRPADQSVSSSMKVPAGLPSPEAQGGIHILSMTGGLFMKFHACGYIGVLCHHSLPVSPVLHVFSPPLPGQVWLHLALLGPW